MMITVDDALQVERTERLDITDRYWELLQESYMQGVAETVQYFVWACKRLEKGYTFMHLMAETTHVAIKPNNPQTDLDLEFNKGRLKGLDVVMLSDTYQLLLDAAE